MTSTNIQIGINENNRSSSKVLKPPGGGSSDIFGANNASTSNRNVKHHLASNIFAAPENKNGFGGDARRNQSSNDSHNRLFGDVERPYTPAKNHFKSNIPIGGDSVDSNAGATNGKTNGHAHVNGNGVAAESVISNGSKNEPNDSPRSNISSASSQRSNNNIIMMSPNNDNRNIIELMDHSSIQKPNHLDINYEFHNNNNNHVTPSPTISSLTSISTSTTSSSLTDDFSHNNNASHVVKSATKLTPRNPVTGCGIEDTFRRPRKLDIHCNRDGNPVTGVGYKPEINTSVPALNGTKQVINKNRIPPGGFSSGLW